MTTPHATLPSPSQNFDHQSHFYGSQPSYTPELSPYAFFLLHKLKNVPYWDFREHPKECNIYAKEVEDVPSQNTALLLISKMLIELFLFRRRYEVQHIVYKKCGVQSKPAITLFSSSSIIRLATVEDIVNFCEKQILLYKKYVIINRYFYTVEFSFSKWRVFGDFRPHFRIHLSIRPIGIIVNKDIGIYNRVFFWNQLFAV